MRKWAHPVAWLAAVLAALLLTAAREARADTYFLTVAGLGCLAAKLHTESDTG